MTDSEVTFLRTTLGVTGGSLQDLRRAYYGTTGSINDAEIAFLKSKSATGQSLQDLRFSYYKSVGTAAGSASLTDFRNNYWLGGGTPPVPVNNPTTDNAVTDLTYLAA